VLKHRIRVPCALWDPVKVKKITIFKSDHLIGVGISCSDWRDVVGMVAIAPKGMYGVGRHPIVRTVRACERDLERRMTGRFSVSHLFHTAQC
jgi:hypothetical protein